MRKKNVELFTVILGIAFAALAVSCGGGSTSDSRRIPTAASTNADRATPSSPVSASPAGGAATVVKMIESQGDPNTAWKFEPAQSAVNVGDTITFQNTGAEPHTATADDNSFDTGTVNAGEAKTVTFSKAGTIAFHCSFHPWMKGTITVSAGGSSP